MDPSYWWEDLKNGKFKFQVKSTREDMTAAMLLRHAIVSRVDQPRPTDTKPTPRKNAPRMPTTSRFWNENKAVFAAEKTSTFVRTGK